MSSILLHGILPSQFFFRWWWVAIPVALQGMLPDLIGLGGTLFGNWELYNWSHQYHLWLAPVGWLHVWMDSFLHAPEGGWNVWAYWVEGLFWFAFFGSVSVRYRDAIRVLDDRYPGLATFLTVSALGLLLFLYYKAIAGLL